MVAKPDGRLTHDLDPNDRPPRDACGVFGVWSPGEDVAKLAYYGLHALQHRGQESAGIAVSDGRRIVVHKEMGLVAQVFDEPSLTALRGDIAVAHCRYSTTGAPVWANAQPTFRSTPTVSIALGHNGNLTNTRELAAMLPPESGFAGLQATSDTDVLTELIAGGAGTGDGGVEEASARILPLVRGAYSLVLHGREHAVRGARPAGVPAAGDRAAGRRLGGGERDRGAGHRRRVLRARGRAGRADLPGRAGRAVAAVRAGRAQGVPVRVRLPGQAGHHDRGQGAARHPG